MAFIITGNKSRDGISRSIKKLCDLTGGTIIDLNFAIINTTSKNYEELNLLKTFEILSQKGITCSYNPYMFAPIKVKWEEFGKSCIFLIFKKNTLITGSKTIHECNNAFNYIQNLLFDNCRQKLLLAIENKQFNVLTNSTVELTL